MPLILALTLKAVNAISKGLSILVISLLCSITGNGQVDNQFNINRHNGLPANHVYYTIKDSHGYLWMCTTQGVVRYNGYSFKIFDISDGMANSDVWFLFEDNKKRIWLSSLSTELGYIHNDKYKKVYIRDTDPRIFPHNMVNTRSGIAFCNLSRKDNLNSEICIEQNDTLYNYPCRPFTGFYVPQPNGNIIISNQAQYYKAATDGTHIYAKPLCYKDSSFNENNGNIGRVIYNNSAVSYVLPLLSRPDYYNKSVSVQNLENCKNTVLPLVKNAKEQISLIYVRDNMLYIITDKNSYRYDSLFRLIDVFANTQLISNEQAARNVISILDDSFWGKCIASTSNGIYIDFKSQGVFKKEPYSFANYVYAGQTIDSTHFWWNKQENKLAIFEKNGSITYKTYNEFSSIKIVPYDHEKSLLLANDNICWLNNHNKKTSLFLGNTNYYSADVLKTSSDAYKYMYRNPVTAINVGKDFFFIFHDNIFDFLFYRDSVSVKSIDSYKYKEFVYDSCHHYLWMHSDDKILIYDLINHKKLFIRKSTLNACGITKIEKLLIDEKYGNIFIKDFNHFFVFNYRTLKYRELYGNYNLTNATFRLQNDVLIAAGAFGVFFSKIKGAASVSEPFLYKTIKNILYQDIEDIQVSTKSVLLNTDKGVYTVQIPSDSALEHNKHNRLSDSYKLVLSYQDSISNITAGDTIMVKQYATALDFDVINPEGSGTIKYLYRIAEISPAWHELNANELHLPRIAPGRYYTLSLRVYDDVWKSKQIDLCLYEQPYWWQTTRGKQALWLSSIMLLFIAIVVAIYITQRIEVRKNEKNNLQLGLELRALYSQLNPHFIFNSLNLTLYLISKNKLEDAYSHVSKFSRLLRAYLKSTRNRFITIAEECANLANYIELQQMRFDNIFSYEINIDPLIEKSTTFIPALLLQPIVENAINHGLLPRGEGGCLTIRFALKQENKTITCTVDDNGVGRKKAAKSPENESVKKESYGTSLTNELVDIFNRYEYTGISITYIDKQLPESGTTVIIEIKNPHYNDKQIHVHNHR